MCKPQLKKMNKQKSDSMNAILFLYLFIYLIQLFYLFSFWVGRGRGLYMSLSHDVHSNLAPSNANKLFTGNQLSC